MPDISKINALDIGSVSKVDGLAKASILDIDGVAVPSAFTGLLDTYTGAAAGYSTRRLATSATNLMRIREDSGDTETDIGYDSNNELDTAAIASHCGTANGFVVSWVDQSSNSNDADQSTTTAQPKIYDGTTQAVITENGKPIITSSSNAYMQTAYDGNAIFFSVAQPLDGSILGQYDLTSGGGSNSNGWLYMAEAGYGGAAFGSDITINSARKNGSAYSTTGADADQIYTDFNGQNLLYTSLSTASQNLNFGYRPGPGVFPMWSMQEFIIYPDTSTHTPSDIEDNINGFFSIY